MHNLFVQNNEIFKIFVLLVEPYLIIFAKKYKFTDFHAVSKCRSKVPACL